MNEVDIQSHAFRLYSRAKEGGKVYAVCPSKARESFIKALISNLGETDRVNGLSYNIGKGTLYVVSPKDIAWGGEVIGLVSFSEADADESKGMVSWRGKASQVIP